MSKLSEINERYRGGAIDTLVALVECGPLWDGNVPSKSGRDLLCEMGLATRCAVKGEDGYQVAILAGAAAYREHFGNSDYLKEAIAFRKAGAAIRSAKWRSDQ
jgi:hypothetical protein